MRILVTGGAGFIGGHLAEAFLEDGHDVCVLDTLEPFYAEGIKRHTLDVHREVADGRDVTYRFREGDVRDRETVEALVADADGDGLNIGSSDNISIRKLAEVVQDQVAAELTIECEGACEADAEHTHASVGKAGELIGYEPSRTITEGVGEFIEWYEQNREWYEQNREWYEPLVRSS